MAPSNGDHLRFWLHFLSLLGPPLGKEEGAASQVANASAAIAKVGPARGGRGHGAKATDLRTPKRTHLEDPGTPNWALKDPWTSPDATLTFVPAVDTFSRLKLRTFEEWCSAAAASAAAARVRPNFEALSLSLSSTLFPPFFCVSPGMPGVVLSFRSFYIHPICFIRVFLGTEPYNSLVECT